MILKLPLPVILLEFTDLSPGYDVRALGVPFYVPVRWILKKEIVHLFLQRGSKPMFLRLSGRALR